MCKRSAAAPWGCTKWLQLIIFRNNSVYKACCSVKGAIYIGLFLIIFKSLLHTASLPRSYGYIPESDITSFLFYPDAVSHKQVCFNKGHKVNIQSVLKEIQSKNYSVNDSNLRKMWKEKNCVPLKVALVVPYRNRKEQLNIFLQYMHWFLQHQLLDYHIYIVEQSDKMDFNRALLFNIGYTEARKRDKIPCFIFHDVDLLPENTDNIYACTVCPRHMSACVNTMRYTLIYHWLFGGAVAMLSEHFEQVNGFSNRYFGWGGEDDDMSIRISENNLDICRFSPLLSRYTMLPHKREAPNAERHNLLKKAADNRKVDGLSDIASKYEVVKADNELRHTIFHIEAL